jgi:hypothetical protein
MPYIVVLDELGGTAKADTQSSGMTGALDVMQEPAQLERC